MKKMEQPTLHYGLNSFLVAEFVHVCLVSKDASKNTKKSVSPDCVYNFKSSLGFKLPSHGTN